MSLFFLVDLKAVGVRVLPVRLVPLVAGEAEAIEDALGEMDIAVDPRVDAGQVDALRPRQR